MKRLILVSLYLFPSLLLSNTSLGKPIAGFYIPDSLREVSLTYKSINNLIILPVIINDSIQVNLILDTGCRNLVLFGKRFRKYFNTEENKDVKFSGLGNGKAVFGALSINNKVTIGKVVGEKIPVILVREQNLFGKFTAIDGVIGYEIFMKFEIELNPSTHTIRFRDAATATLPAQFLSVPLRVEDSRPLLDGKLTFSTEHSELCNLMIDTGSTLGLLLKTSELKSYSNESPKIILGRGLNGLIEGIKTRIKKVELAEFQIHDVDTGIMYSPWHNYASIGMNVLKDYMIILNYCKSYAGFKKFSG